MNNCTNLYYLSTIACALSECLTQDELSVLSAEIDKSIRLSFRYGRALHIPLFCQYKSPPSYQINPFPNFYSSSSSNSSLLDLFFFCTAFTDTSSNSKSARQLFTSFLPVLSLFFSLARSASFRTCSNGKLKPEAATIVSLLP